MGVMGRLSAKIDRGKGTEMEALPGQWVKRELISMQFPQMMSWLSRNKIRIGTLSHSYKLVGLHLRIRELNQIL